MKIIKATPFEAEAAFAIIQSSTAHMSAQGIDQWDAIYPSREVIDADIAEGALYLAASECAWLGLVVLNETQSKPYEAVKWLFVAGRILVVHRLAIAPEAQRQGVAWRLMQFTEIHARQNGYSAIRLDAFIKNPAAVKLYEKLNYRLAGTVEFRKGPFYCFEKSFA